MKKQFSLLTSILLIFTLLFPVFHIKEVHADSSVLDKKVYKDGVYELPFVILKDNSDDRSMTNDYMQSPGKLTVKDGKNIVQLTLKNSSWWQYFKVQAIQPGAFTDNNFVDAPVISEDTANNTRVVEFEVKDLEQVLNAKIHVIVTDIPGFTYDNKYDIRFSFNASGVPLVEQDSGSDKEEDVDKGVEPDTGTNPDEGKTPDKETDAGKEETPDQGTNPTEEPTIPQPEVIEIPNGNYTIGLQALHATKDSESGMAKYIKKEANVSVVNGSVLLTITLVDNKVVKGFQVEQNGKLVNPVSERTNEKEDTRDVTYKLDQLITPLNARVQYTATMPNGSVHEGDQPLRLSFNKDQIVEKEEETPGQGSEETPGQSGGETPNQGTDKDPVNKPAAPKGKYKDGEYQLPFVILKDKGNDRSMTNDYMQSPGKLIVKDGKNIVQLTLKNSSWWQYFKVQTNQPGAFTDNNFADAKIISKDVTNDTRVVEFEVKDLEQVLNAKIHVIVTGIPGFTYDNKYDIRFSFDASKIPLSSGEKPKPKDPNGEESKPEPKDSNGKEEPKPAPKGQNGEEEPKPIPKKQNEEPKGNNNHNLNFDRDGDGTKNNNIKSQGKIGSNPKTSDPTKLALFTALLLASATPFIIKLRKRKKLTA